MTEAEKLAKKKNRRPRTAPRELSGRRKKWNCLIPAKRNELGLTVADVASAVGLTCSSVSVIERGADPQLTSAHRLAKFFGMTIDQLWPEPL